MTYVAPAEILHKIKAYLQMGGFLAINLFGHGIITTIYVVVID